MVAAEIHVCQAGSCRREGGEAVLKEIEELAKGFDCSVEASGCVGACSQAPNAVVVKKRGSETLHTRLDDVEKSAEVVRQVTGQAPNLDEPGLRQRLTAARQLRVRRQAKGETKWNLAMAGMAEQIASTVDPDDRLELQYEHAILSRSAGAWEQALRSLVAVEEVVGAHPEVILEEGKVLSKLGRLEELAALQQRARDASCAQLPRVLGALKANMRDAANGEQPREIEGYARWRLDVITPVSKHSAVYRFTSTDRKRGTPYVRGKGRTMWHRTWHTTLLCEVGANGEGPLPWVERDYTPVSTWMGARLPVAPPNWERGSVDILIKIYRDGKGTSWLQQQPLGTQVWLSKPMKTLSVPSLVPDSSRMSNNMLANHEGVLLVLAGTGIVAAAQVPQCVLQHTDPATCFGTSATGCNKPPLASPVSLVFACRADDVLMASELASWCAAGPNQARLERCVLAISPPAQNSDGEPTPFPEAAVANLEALRTLANVRVCEGRVTQEMLAGELAPLRARTFAGVPTPGVGGRCRVVVSGPASFNGAVKEMLIACGLETERITILSA